MGLFGAVKNNFAKAKSAYADLGLVGGFFSFTQGRATGFGLAFTICGLIGFFKHYDLTSYSLFVAAVFTGVLGHSLKEDYFQTKNRQISLDEKKQDSSVETVAKTVVTTSDGPSQTKVDTTKVSKIPDTSIPKV